MKFWTDIILDNYPHPEELEPDRFWKEGESKLTRLESARENADGVLVEYGHCDYKKRKVGLQCTYAGLKLEHVEKASEALWREADKAIEAVIPTIRRAIFRLQTLGYDTHHVTVPCEYHVWLPDEHPDFKGIPINMQRTGSQKVVKAFSPEEDEGHWVVEKIVEDAS